MTQYVIANNVNTQLAATASSSSTTLTLASSTNLPTLSSGQIMPLTLNDAATGQNYEIVYVTAITGVTLTVIRAQEGTGALTWNVGDYAFCGPTAGTVATSQGNPADPFAVAPATAANQAPQMAQVAGVVGAARNLTMSVTTASATATLSADEIIVETALGGIRYCLPNFSKPINLATTGAGGMDTGTAPVSGFVALYAIYSPSTQTAALLATNATSAAQPNVYGGANMPSGYTASALVTVVPTNSSSQFVAIFVQDRKVSINQVQVLSQGFTAASAVTSLSIAGAVPKNAKRVGGSLSQSTSTAANFVWLFFASTVGIGEQQYSVNTTGGGGNLFAYSGLDLSTAQTLVYQVQTISAGTGTAVLFVSSYEI